MTRWKDKDGAGAVRRVADRTRDAGSKRAADMALRTIELQRKAFNGAIRGIGSLQDRTGKMLHQFAKSASWVPDEGRQVVDEWTKVTKRGREDFQRSLDKSFDLLSQYFERVKKGGPAPKKKTAAKRKRSARKTSLKRDASKSPAAES
jgi:hypothetical protein